MMAEVEKTALKEARDKMGVSYRQIKRIFLPLKRKGSEGYPRLFKQIIRYCGISLAFQITQYSENQKFLKAIF
jgi:hypothetical protein